MHTYNYVAAIHVDGSKHPFYHQTCVICERLISTGRVILAIRPIGFNSAQAFMHRSCIEEVLVDAPLDDVDAKMEKITQNERRGHGLLASLTLNEASELPKV
jgi:hypothetical protein